MFSDTHDEAYEDLEEAKKIIKMLLAKAPPVQIMDAMKLDNGKGRVYSLGSLHEKNIRKAWKFLNKE